MNRAVIDDIDAAGRIVGRVSEEGRPQGISAVDVRVVDAPTRALTDTGGRFVMSGVQPGLIEIELDRLGYATRRAYLVVQPGSTVQIDASMSTDAIPLAAIEVEVRSRRLEFAGFYERAGGAGGGWGSQLTRQDVQNLVVDNLGSLFQRVVGVRVDRGGGVGGRTRALGRRGCELAVYLNGMPMADFDLESISVDWLEGVEVYRGQSIPIQYAYGANGCGVVLIWTG